MTAPSNWKELHKTLLHTLIVISSLSFAVSLFAPSSPAGDICISARAAPGSHCFFLTLPPFFSHLSFLQLLPGSFTFEKLPQTSYIKLIAFSVGNKCFFCGGFFFLPCTSLGAVPSVRAYNSGLEMLPTFKTMHQDLHWQIRPCNLKANTFGESSNYLIVRQSARQSGHMPQSFVLPTHVQLLWCSFAVLI